MSHKPGMRNFPRPSRTRTPSGTLVDAEGPTTAMRPSRTITVRSDRGTVSVPSMTVTLVKATAGDDGAGDRGAHAPVIAIESGPRKQGARMVSNLQRTA